MGLRPPASVGRTTTRRQARPDQASRRARSRRGGSVSFRAKLALAVIVLRSDAIEGTRKFSMMARDTKEVARYGCRGASAESTVALVTVATGETPEQYRRVGPSERETTNRSRAWLRRLLDGSTNVDRLRGGGMIRKGQVRNIGGRDIKAQARFTATLFEVAA